MFCAFRQNMSRVFALESGKTCRVHIGEGGHAVAHIISCLCNFGDAAEEMSSSQETVRKDPCLILLLVVRFKRMYDSSLLAVQRVSLVRLTWLCGYSGAARCIHG